jgi:hypothetical protein
VKLKQWIQINGARRSKSGYFAPNVRYHDDRQAPTGQYRALAVPKCLQQGGHSQAAVS